MQVAEPLDSDSRPEPSAPGTAGDSVDAWRQTAAEGRPDPDAEHTPQESVDALRRLKNWAHQETGPRPVIWRVPARNQAFTGRQPLLATLHRQLTEAGRVLVAALHGLGGVGKTQLAIEYAHLFAGDYSLVWWVDAERVELVADQLAALGAAAGWVDVGTRTPDAVTVVAGRLRQLPGWLLVFDNAEDPATLRPFLPPGSGHTIITSRASDFTEIATPIEVSVFCRHESSALLRNQVPALSEIDADRIAEALGDLPLALAQAVGLLAGTRMTAAEYLEELATRTTALLLHRAPPSYPRPLAGALTMSLEQLAQLDTSAVQLLYLCAHLSPEPIPLAWIRAAPAAALPESLAGLAAGSSLGWRECLGRIAALGLARLSGEAIQLHRLTQSLLREWGDPAQQHRALAARLIAAAAPDNGHDPAQWPTWTALLPHLLALDPAVTTLEDLRDTACHALQYLVLSGQYHAARPLAHAWYQQWRAIDGADHPYTLLVAHHLASTLRSLGDYPQARSLDEDTLTRRRRVLGEDHPDTLNSANNLTLDLRRLGEWEQARQLNEDTLIRYRRVLGDEHPFTVRSTSNLAVVLRRLGELEQARQLNEDSLDRYRRVLGDDHPDTLRSATNLALDLRQLGELHQARDLDQETLAAYRRVLGDDHPDTLNSATNLALDLRQLGELHQARDLDQETLAAYRRVLGDDHPDTLACAANLAEDLRLLSQ